MITNNQIIDLLTKIHVIMETVVLVVATAAAIYEVLARVVPTSKTWSIIGNIINTLKRISDAFDAGTKQKRK